MTVIVGAGPVGLFAALALARREAVTLVGDRAAAGPATRIDTVPLGLLALFVEFGIQPGQIGAVVAQTAMLTAWEGDEPQAFSAPAKAHIDRQLLERELWRRVEETAAITVAPRRTMPPPGDRTCIDATGRVAWSAGRIVRPPTPWIARTLILRNRFGEAQQAFRIAAFPGGYVYRSATSELMTLGFVGPRGQLPEIGPDPRAALISMGLRWMLAGIAPDAPWRSARGGEASVQWTRGSAAIARVGDANFACDALASQGMALGISDALALVRGDPLPNRFPRHFANLRATISRCRFSRMPAWREYGHFLENAGVSMQHCPE